jgi:hypothetical protein
LSERSSAPADERRDEGSPWLARPALDFLVLAAAALAGVALVPGWPRWLLLWPAAAWGVLAWAFHANRPGTLAKRVDGSRPLAAVVFWAPYLLWPRLVRLSKWIAGRDPVPWHEVAPGVWLGRRPRRGERTPAAAVAVDLAAEWATPAPRVAPARYLALPSLNKLPPPAVETARLVAELGPHPGPIFVFCSAGKGRSAAFAAALLVARGTCATADEAERRLATVRPGVRLHPGQRRLVERFRPAERSLPCGPPPAIPPTAAAGS